MRTRRTRRLIGCGLLALALGLSVPAVATADDAPPTAAPGDLALVTMNGGGTAAGRAEAPELLAAQDAVLTAVGAGEPVYRWTTALNGFAVRLTEAQLTALVDQPGVASVEADSIRPMAGRTSFAAVRGAAASPRLRGGAGVVIGVVDSGIAPESPAFAEVPGLGVDPEGFAGACAEGDGWAANDCTRKIVGARWYVGGFGADRVRSSESLSPRDALGHGTQVSSVAAGNAGVSVRVDDRDAGFFGGVAPQARVAAYKACWGAPDPADDGCSTADVVSAVDAAVADGVDVLSLALAGGELIDTLQVALLGAAEADVVVIGASGNSGSVGLRRARGPVGHDRRRRRRPDVAGPGRAPRRPFVGRRRAPCHGAGPRRARPGRGRHPGRRDARPRSAGSGPSTRAWSPTGSWSASGAGSGASTSPSPSRRPVAVPWCSSTVAPAR